MVKDSGQCWMVYIVYSQQSTNVGRVEIWHLMTMVQLICNLSKGKMVLMSEDMSSESEYFEDSQFMMVRKTLCILMAIFIEAANIVGMKQRRGNRTFLSSQSK